MKYLTMNVEPIDVVGYVAVVATILQFLSGILVCKQYVTNRTTGEATPLPFTCGIISCALWFSYGVIKGNNNIIFVNTVGILLMSVYTAIFFVYTFKKSSILKQIAGVCIILFIVIGFVTVADDDKYLLNCLGQAASFFTLMMIAAPLSKLVHVIRMKSTECLPFPMIVSSLVVSSLWFVYGTMDEDMYLVVTNGLGVMLAFTELSLFFIYPHAQAGIGVAPKNFML